MGLKPDSWIKEMATTAAMIEPFVDYQVKSQGNLKVISYGLSSYGYDIRVSDHFKVFTNVYNALVDPKDFSESAFVNLTGEFCIIPPNSFALSRSVERFKIPRDVLTLCIGKSTDARCGIIVNVTPFEPEWEGYVTLEISKGVTWMIGLVFWRWWFCFYSCVYWLCGYSDG